MAVREFVDSSGVKWRVWKTRPSRGDVLSEEFEYGWLTFESTTTLRRCTPVPPGWEAASAEQLEAMCLAATETKRHTPTGGSPVVGGEQDEPEERPGR